VRIFCTKALCAAFSHFHVTREKLPKRLSDEKGARKMLMKLTTDINAFALSPLAKKNEVCYYAQKCPKK